VFACPHCGERSLSLMQKAACTHRYPAHCSDCSGNSFVPQWWIATVGTLLGISLFLVVQHLERGRGLWFSSLEFLGLFLLTFAVAFLSRWFAPLRRSDLPGNREFRAGWRFHVTVALVLCLGSLAAAAFLE
jgi:hypothetical protein